MEDQRNDAERLRWEERIVERARRDDREAFAELYRVYAPIVFRRVLLPRLGNHVAAEDALAETFRSAFERISTFEPRGQSIVAWLSRIAANKATDMHRARAVTGRALASFEAMVAPIVEPVVGPEAALTERRNIESVREHIRLVFEVLNPRYSQAIRLRFIEERTREECAQALDVKLGTFDVLLLRALRAFRKEWETAVAEPGAPDV